MNKSLFTTSVFASLTIIGVVGCGRKLADPQIEIEKAKQSILRAEPSQTRAMDKAGITPPPAQQMNEALASYKSGNLEDAVTRFQKMRVHGALTGEQLAALNGAMAAVMGDIYARAAKGDSRAQAAVKEYERMQNAPK